MSAPLRALFFSHDRRGLGHLRRTLALADLLLDHSPKSVALIVTGSRMAHAFRTRPRLDYVKLPSITRGADGHLLPSTLNLPVEEVLAMREELLLQTTRSFRPDVFLVDSPPLAGNDEVASTIAHIRGSLPRTAIVLNFRDILDDPTRVAESWGRHSVLEAMAEGYDLILIHGSQQVYNFPEQYRFSDELRAKTFFCGYVPYTLDATPSDVIRQRVGAVGRKLLVLTVGGGSDGIPLIERCLAGVSSSTELLDLHTVVIMGSDMSLPDSASLRARYSGHSNIVLIDFVQSAEAYFAAADVIVSMGGYNTLSEIVALKKSAIVVPRLSGSTEQFIRANRFAELGLLTMLHPEEATPERIAALVLRSLRESLAPSEPLERSNGATFSRMIEDVAASRACRDGCV